MNKRTIKTKLSLVDENDESRTLSVVIQIEANHAHDIDRMLQGLSAQITMTPGYKSAEGGGKKKKAAPVIELSGSTV